MEASGSRETGTSNICASPLAPTLREEIRNAADIQGVSPSPSSRRASEPNNFQNKELRESIEIEGGLKKTKSTPRAFAPLCVLAKSELRHLHNCTSHSNLPHLWEEKETPRRASCPRPHVKPVIVIVGQEAENRRQSFPLSKREVKNKGRYLHRCKGHLTASLLGLEKKTPKPKAPARSSSEPTFDHRATRVLDNRISRSIHMLYTWSSEILDDPVLKNSIGPSPKKDLCRVSSRFSLRSIHEEEKTIL